MKYQLKTLKAVARGENLDAGKNELVHDPEGCRPRISMLHMVMPLTVHNDDVGRRRLEIPRPFQAPAVAPIATRDYPFPATRAFANVDSSS